MDSSTILSLLQEYRYAVLFPLALIEGPIVAVVAGWFVAQGIFQILPVYSILICGDLIPDALYYYLGYRTTSTEFSEKYGKSFNITMDRLRFIENLWKFHTFKSALFSKWAYGLSTVLLMSAGLVHFPLKKFITATLSVSVLQYGILLTIGYYFGSSYKTLGTYLENTSIAVTVIVAILVIVYFSTTRYIRSILLRSSE